MIRRTIVLAGLGLMLARPGLAAPLATGDHDTGQLVAEVTEAVRRDGVLTVKVRYRVADGAELKGNEVLYSGPRDGYDKAYLVAERKKYFVLKDGEGAPLMPDAVLLRGPRAAGAQAGAWWGKFPAPPAEVRDFSLTLPHTAPMDAIPISDG